MALGRCARSDDGGWCEADLQVLDVFVGRDVRIGEVEFEQDCGADLRVHCDGWVGDLGALVCRRRP